MLRVAIIYVKASTASLSFVNEIINLFVCDTKRWWRTIGGIFSDRCEHGAGRRRGRVRCVRLLEEAKAEQARTHRRFGTSTIKY